MTRLRVVLQAVKYAPTVHDRQINIQCDCRRVEDFCQLYALLTVGCNQDFEAVVVRASKQNLGEVSIILDDEKYLVPRLNSLSVIRNRRLNRGHLMLLWCGSHHGVIAPKFSRVRDVLALFVAANFRCWRQCILRQIEGKRAALIWSADETNFTAQQPGDFTTNRQPQSSSSVFTTRGTVRLLERLKNNTLFILGDTNACIRNGEGYDSFGLVQCIRIKDPSGSPGQSDPHRN